MTSLESAIILAVRDCERSEVKPVARNIQPRLPSRHTFSRRWLEIKMQEMARRGLLVKAPGRSGFRADVTICQCCGQPITRELHMAS